jgi:hypothetical protein
LVAAFDTAEVTPVKAITIVKTSFVFICLEGFELFEVKLEVIIAALRTS